MKFIVSSAALLKQLQQISGVINTNTVLPILEDFLFEIEKNKLTVVATDLETVMKVELDIEAKDSGKVCIPAKILMDSLKNIPDQPLTFTIEKNFAIEITSDNGKYKVMGENPDNFPKEPTADDATAFTMTSTALTGTRQIARAAPNGRPRMAAIAVADRLTDSDSRPIGQRSGLERAADNIAPTMSSIYNDRHRRHPVRSLARLRLRPSPIKERQLGQREPVQLKCATFDEIVAAGAKYHPPSRPAERPLRIPHTQITDSRDDFVILDNAVLTPEAGIAWRGYWIADSIQYLGPGRDWQTAPWLPGKYDAVTNTIDIDSVNLQAKTSYDQPLFFIDATIGKENFAHFIFDTLPYGALFQKVRQNISTLLPLVRSFEFPHQEPLFNAVFDFCYKDSVCYGGGVAVRVKQLVLPRRQTDFEGPSWRLPFAGVRHIRDSALRRWARR